MQERGKPKPPAMNITEDNQPAPTQPLARPLGLRPLPAIPGGALPLLRATPPHDLLVLTQRPDLTPEFFQRLVRVEAPQKAHAA